VAVEKRALVRIDKLRDTIKSLEASKDQTVKGQLTHLKPELKSIMDSLIGIRNARIELKGQQSYPLNNYNNEGLKHNVFC
jgi:hypothetical protein